MDTESPRLRMSVLGIVALSLFGALFARLLYLQVMAAPEFQVEAQANRVRKVSEEAPRGRILDAKGRVLVDNRTSLVVTVNPHDLASVDGRDGLLLNLARVLTDGGVPTKVSTIERRLNDRQFNPLQPVPVAVDVPESLYLYLSERADEFPSVEVQRRTVRTYPYGSAAAHVLGYVGRISQEELATKQGGKDDARTIAKPYEPDSEIGKTGVESTYEDDLRGTPGIRTIEIDARNRPVRTVDYQPPQRGNDVQLTIDVDVQLAAEKALADELESLRGGRQRDGKPTKAPAGSVVVTDPRNGSIVAMASYPTYNPEEFVNGISSERYAQLTGGAQADPFTNRAIQGLYAPGSTFKPVTATAALNTGMITPQTSYVDNGSYKVGNITVYNAGREAHGPVNLQRSLTVSSDVFYYWLGDRFWRERDSFGNGIQDTAHAYGLGSATGVPLPGEAGGLIPDPETKKRRHDKNPQAFPEGNWYSGDNVNLAIGQGDVLVTPLQLAGVYATIANGGTVYQPQVVARVLTPLADPWDPATVVRVIQPVVRSNVDLPPGTRDPIVTGLKGVTASHEGTAFGPFQGFDLRGFPVVGKTGTAQVSGKADTSVFAAFGPADSPGYAVAAVLEESGFGADAAAPVVRRVFESITGQTPTLPGSALPGSGAD